MPQQMINAGQMMPYSDYQAELEDLQRRQAYADLLRQQALKPVQGAGMAGRTVAPISWTQGAAQMLNSAGAGVGEQQVLEGRKELSKRYQNDLARALAQGTPEAFMQHPATQPLGMQMLLGKMYADQLKGVMGRQTQPTQPGMGAGTASAMDWGPGAVTPTMQQQPQGQGFPGVSPTALGLSMLPMNPMAEPLSKLIQSGYTEANKPVVNRGYGIGTMQGGRYVPDTASTEQARSMEQIKADVAAQYGHPVELQVSNQRKLQLFPPEIKKFNETGTLPARYAQLAPELPGIKFEGQSPAGFPRETSQQFSDAMEARRAILVQERAQLRQQGKTDPALEREIARLPPKPDIGVLGATQSQQEQITQQRQTAGGKSVDEAFAKDYPAFIQGGAQDAMRQLAQLKDVIGTLSSRTDITGPIRGLFPDVVRNITNPQAVATKERIEEVVQRSLRAILGAQFTENEGKRLIARAYNEQQPESENLVRVQRLATQLEQALKNKSDAARYFEQNGTLQGWSGTLPSISDFDPTATPQRRSTDQPSAQDIVNEMRRRGLVK